MCDTEGKKKIGRRWWKRKKRDDKRRCCYYERTNDGYCRWRVRQEPTRPDRYSYNNNTTEVACTRRRHHSSFSSWRWMNKKSSVYCSQCPRWCERRRRRYMVHPIQKRSGLLTCARHDNLRQNPEKSLSLVRMSTAFWNSVSQLLLMTSHRTVLDSTSTWMFSIEIWFFVSALVVSSLQIHAWQHWKLRLVWTDPLISVSDSLPVCQGFVTPKGIAKSCYKQFIIIFPNSLLEELLFFLWMKVGPAL